MRSVSADPAAGPPNYSSGDLPIELSSFVGREREIAELKRLLTGPTRLLTLTGPGGCGKTRLAMAVAFGVVEDFEDGAWSVGLAPISDPALVVQEATRVLGVREAPGRTPTEALVEHLGSKRLLLILDNCEHLVEACAALAGTLLRSCPGLRILATSREALGIAGESAWVVPSLSLPDLERPPDLGYLARSEAVRLFVERAKGASGFGLTGGNAPAVGRVCRRLEGIPLAIELAAARTKVLSAEQIFQRLEDSLKLLAGRDRTAPARQRTLRGTMDWSYGLLGEQERKLFGRLSVFAGGWTLEAAEAVAAGDGIEVDVLDLLSQLVDKSMVVAEPGGEGAARYRMLEPIRQYGKERLEESGEAERVWEKHARIFLAVAEEAEPELRGARQGEWLERLGVEHHNCREALSWALEREKAEMGLRLGGALGEFWVLRGHLDEGRRWLEAILAIGGPAPEAARAKALRQAGWIVWEQGDYERSMALNEASLALFRELGDETGVARSLFALGMVELHREKLAHASALLEEAIEIERASGDTAGVARVLPSLGLVAVVRHDFEQALALHEESLAMAREAGDDFVIGFSLAVGALAYLGLGDYGRAGELLEEDLERFLRRRMMHHVAVHLHVSAALAAVQGQAVRSARLWGAAEALREAIGAHLSPAERSHYAPYIAAARDRLEGACWEKAWEEGRQMTPERTVEYVLEASTPTSSPKEDKGALSARELQVLRLVAEGLSDNQIAERLYLSPRTVGHHLRSVYRKLGVRSRTAAVRAAVESALI